MQIGVLYFMVIKLILFFLGSSDLTWCGNERTVCQTQVRWNIVRFLEFYKRQVKHFLIFRILQKAIELYYKKVFIVFFKKNLICLFFSEHYRVLIHACGRVGYFEKAFQLYKVDFLRLLASNKLLIKYIFNSDCFLKLPKQTTVIQFDIVRT